MKLQEILNDKRFPELLKEYWHIEFSFDDKSFEESPYYKKVILGYNFSEYYLEGMPYSKYFKRYGNLLKVIPKKEKEIIKIKVGCSGRNFEKVYQITDLDKFFKETECIH